MIMRKAMAAMALILLMAPAVWAEDAAEPFSKEIEFARGLMASDFDKKLDKVPLAKWLASALPPDVEAVWEPVPNDCGEQTGDPAIDSKRDIPMCAGIELMRGGARVGYILLMIGSASTGAVRDKAGYYSGEVELRGARQCVKSLGELPELFTQPGALRALGELGGQ